MTAGTDPRLQGIVDPCSRVVLWNDLRPRQCSVTFRGHAARALWMVSRNEKRPCLNLPVFRILCNEAGRDKVCERSYHDVCSTTRISNHLIVGRPTEGESA